MRVLEREEGKEDEAAGAMGGGAGQSMRGVDSSTPWQMGRARSRARQN
jgi:hypothetical protein